MFPTSTVCDYRCAAVKITPHILRVIITEVLTWLRFSRRQSKLTEHQRKPPSDCLLKSSAFWWAHAIWNNLIQTGNVGCAQCSAEETWLKPFWCWHCASVRDTAVLLVTWSCIKSEVSHVILVKTREISWKWTFRLGLKRLSVALFPCEIPRSATVTLGPPCQFQSGCFGANCLGDTEQIINSSPLRLTLLGEAGFCIYMSRLSRPEPDPWRTATHCYDAHIRFSTHLK